MIELQVPTVDAGYRAALSWQLPARNGGHRSQAVADHLPGIEEPATLPRSRIRLRDTDGPSQGGALGPQARRIRVLAKARLGAETSGRITPRTRQAGTTDRIAPGCWIAEYCGAGTVGTSALRQSLKPVFKKMPFRGRVVLVQKLLSR